MSFQDLAITLRSVRYEERHRVVTGLTENFGRVSVIARNSIQSRRFGGSLEPFSASLWSYTKKPESNLGHLESAEIRRGFEGLRSDFSRLAVASTLSEIMLRVAPEYEPCPDLFKLHSNALATLDDRDGDSSPRSDLALLNTYMAKVLQWAGHQPQVLLCLGCQKPLKNLPQSSWVACKIAEAGWICEACSSIEAPGLSTDLSFLKIPSDTLWDLHAALTQSIRAASGSTRGVMESQRILFQFMERLFIYHIPSFDQGPLQSLRFLNL